MTLANNGVQVSAVELGINTGHLPNGQRLLNRYILYS